MNKFLIGLILGVLLTGISTKFLIDTALFRVTYCNWDAVENLKQFAIRNSQFAIVDVIKD